MHEQFVRLECFAARDGFAAAGDFFGVCGAQMHVWFLLCVACLHLRKPTKHGDKRHTARNTVSAIDVDTGTPHWIHKDSQYWSHVDFRRRGRGSVPKRHDDSCVLENFGGVHR